jgi:hypothetical protein
MSNGKGDRPRPIKVPPDEWAKRWADTFAPPPKPSTPEPPR